MQASLTNHRIIVNLLPIVTPKYTKLKTGDVVLDCLYSVEKKSGKLESFKPFNISPDEYRRGKKVSFK